MELTVVLPCLDEAATVAGCVRGALAFLEGAGLGGEVVVVDNGSSDRSAALAAAAGARVVAEPRHGYGSAVMTGVRAATTPFVAMADCDASYDFAELGAFVDELHDGVVLVMGNRFAGAIEPGAMPLLHRYFGSPMVGAVAWLVSGTRVRDLNCGMRAFDRDAILALGLEGQGMELASEMVVRAEYAGYTVREVSTTLRTDGRGGRPGHLRPWRDGWRHLRVMAHCWRTRRSGRGPG